MSYIHRTAIVSAKAQIAHDVRIGAYTIIGDDVSIGAGTEIANHCVIEGRTEIGENNQIYQFNSLGALPQDLKYRGGDTKLVIGEGNIIREFCTFNLGTEDGGGVTQIGDDNLIMAYVHLAHDCQLGNHIIIANSCGLAGHVTLEDWVVLGGNTSIFQRCILGRHSFTGACTYVQADLPPFVSCTGNPAVPRSINKVGLKRRGFAQDRIDRLENYFRILYRQNLSLEVAIAKLKSHYSQILMTKEEYLDYETFMTFLENPKRHHGIIR